MSSRTLGAIAQVPSDNIQGGYYCMNLNTGARIHRRRWTSLPMPTEVIQRVECLTRRDGKTYLMVFTDRLGVEMSEFPIVEPTDDVGDIGHIDRP